MVWPLVVVCVAASLGFLQRCSLGQLKHGIEQSKFGPKPENGYEDRIGELPDEILANILSLLTIKEAVKTSILSRRWRHLSAYLPAINLDWFVMSGAPIPKDLHSGPKSDACGSHKQVFIRHEPDVCSRYARSFRSNVHQFLKTYKSERLSSFELSCCRVEEYVSDVMTWISFGLNKDVEKLSLKFLCADDYDVKCLRNTAINLPTSLLSKLSKLKHLRLHFCILKLDSKWMFNSLVKLDLTYVLFQKNHDAQYILSTCSSLEEVRLIMCEVPSKLYVGDNLQRLKILVVSYCNGLEFIEVCAGNIKTFEFFGSRLVQFKFSEACKIENVFLQIKRGGMDKIFGNLSADLPHLKTLSVGVCSSALYQTPSNPSTFCGVKTLNLFIIERDDRSDLVKALPSLLRSLPRLQKLRVVMPWSEDWEETKEEEHDLWVHKHLKEVEIGGFIGEEHQIRFATYLLRSAIALEQMVIDKCIWRYVGYGDWIHYHVRMPPLYKLVYAIISIRFKCEALSKNVKIIFR